MVAVVGDDFPKEKIEFLKKKNVDFSGLEVADGKTFRWGGKYGFDLNDRDTLFTHLNVFEKFEPKIPNSYKNSEYIFLANIGPDLQMDVLKQIQSPKLVALDTMNYWIGGDLPALRETLKHVDVLIVNDSEVRQLAYEANLVKASKIVQEMGPKTLIIKKGEHGALLITQDSFFWAPAYPLEFIYDPTGAGDTFAGGFMGYMAKSDDISIDNLKRAVVFGSTMASFCVEKFSLERLENLTEEEIRKRFHEFWQMTNFDPNV